MTHPYPRPTGRADPPAATTDLLVVGAGTAGIVAARTAAGFGASVVLVERDRSGGDCLWTGCVPSKALLASAAAAAGARTAGRLGVHVDTVRVDFADVMAHVHGAIAAIEPDDSPQTLRGLGIDVRAGDVVLRGPIRAEVSGTTIEFRQAVIATGSKPAVPPIPGLADAAYLTSDSVWDLRELPRRLVVLGGGAIGCELGQAFARLGSEVTVVEALDRVVAAEDPDASALLNAALTTDDVTVRTGTSVTRVDPDGTGGAVVTDSGERIPYDRLLVAVGRTPRTAGLGCPAAGVDLDERGYVVVDRHLRTTQPRIWAAGDVTGQPQFTHLAGVHGSLAATNAVLGLRRSVDLRAVPRVTYTHPEIASVGAAAEAAATVRTVRYNEVDRAVAEGDPAGFARLHLDRRGRVIGATVVGPRAGETLGATLLAVRRRLPASQLAATTFPYPAYTDGVWNAAIAEVRDGLGSGVSARGIAVLRGIRRRRLDRR